MGLNPMYSGSTALTKITSGIDKPLLRDKLAAAKEHLTHADCRVLIEVEIGQYFPKKIYFEGIDGLMEWRSASVKEWRLRINTAATEAMAREKIPAAKIELQPKTVLAERTEPKAREDGQRRSQTVSRMKKMQPPVSNPGTPTMNQFGNLDDIGQTRENTNHEERIHKQERGIWAPDIIYLQ
ncbi:hypothetical protein Ancab_001394 [Ancistrocladus abbreviatus]